MSILRIKTLKVLDPPGDAGSHIELQIKVAGLNGIVCFPAGNDGKSIDKEAGAIWQVNQQVQFEGSAQVYLYETDSGNDDYYGVESVSAEQVNSDDAIDNILDFGAQNDCRFILSYSVSPS